VLCRAHQAWLQPWEVGNITTVVRAQTFTRLTTCVLLLEAGSASGPGLGKLQGMEQGTDQQVHTRQVGTTWRAALHPALLLLASLCWLLSWPCGLLDLCIRVVTTTISTSATTTTHWCCCCQRLL
jgi:hypothetical protein